MSRDEIAEFLQEGVICRLGCLDLDGHPYVVPCWFQYAEGGFYIVPRARSAWAEYLRQDPRVSLCIDAESGRRVLVRGRAKVVEEPNVGGRWVEIAREMALRYAGQEGLKYLDKTMKEPRWLFFIEAQEIVSSTGGWAERYKHYDWV
jgi:nitroimidazol reductase NimA-like FMN-containing flavoprotein (pyridoxamine 5'-phosphate oxidase superfamily)